MSTIDEEILARTAWLYYMEGLTQADIAAELKLTRLRVNRLIALARQNGLVGIKINARFADCIRLERNLVKEFGLRRAVIVPTPRHGDLTNAVLGRATADFISEHIGAHKTRGLGLGWGATLRETVRHLRPARQPGLKVASILGGLTHGSEINTFNIASEVAARLGASCHYLAAPVYAATRKSRDTILAQEVFRQSFEIIDATDLAVFSAGDLSKRSLLIRYGLPDDVSARELEAAGAVGDIMGQFLDARGALVRHDINERVIALPLDKLRRIPTVVLASGGAHKAAVIAAVLRARLVSVLICDERTARTARRLALATG